MIERIPLVIVLTFVFAGFTGLDGGPTRKLSEVPLDVATKATNPRVYFDIEIDGKKAGQIRMELFKTVVPKTVENFRALCTGEKGKGLGGTNLHYKGSVFHQIKPGFMIQGGNFNGTGGESIYGAKFDDEWNGSQEKDEPVTLLNRPQGTYIPHSIPGLLSMVQASKRNSNGSQFVITTAVASQLDAKQVVFGQVFDGMDVVKAIEDVGDVTGSPGKKKVFIVDCGEIKNKST